MLFIYFQLKAKCIKKRKSEGAIVKAFQHPETQANIIFTSHEMLDDYVKLLQTNIPDFKTKYPAHFKLLQAFDAGYWVNETEDEVAASKKRQCPFSKVAAMHSTVEHHEVKNDKKVLSQKQQQLGGNNTIQTPVVMQQFNKTSTTTTSKKPNHDEWLKMVSANIEQTRKEYDRKDATILPTNSAEPSSPNKQLKQQEANVATKDAIADEQDSKVDLDEVTDYYDYIDTPVTATADMTSTFNVDDEPCDDDDDDDDEEDEDEDENVEGEIDYYDNAVLEEK